MSKVYIHTQGCSHNFSDSEHMAGLLKAAGHELVAEATGADVVIFNTCTVKTPAENAFLRGLKKVQRQNKRIVLSGCVPQADPSRFTGFSLIGTRQLDRVVDVVERTVSGETIQLLQRNEKPSLLFSSARRNPLVEIIPISLGCLDSCTFCKTKLARGHLSSYLPELIIDKVRRATSDGVKEIWLTSQDTGCYGFDIGTTAAYLLTELCKIEKDFKIRFGMGNPNHFKKFADELIRAYTHKRVFKFLHIPVQAGNDAVLAAMRREYKVSDFVSVVSAFRSAIPRITISTDIICGFPGETEEQFMDTIKLLRTVKPDVMNISRFWARSGTVAARMKEQLPGAVIKKRSRLLTEVCEELSLEQNKKWIGWEGPVLIDDDGKNGALIGRNFAYKQVLVRGDLKQGDTVRVRVVDAGVYDLRGEVL